MMEEQELSASFHYEETEAEYNSLREDLAKIQAIEKTRIAVDIAAKALEIALDNYAAALNDIKKLYDAE